MKNPHLITSAITLAIVSSLLAETPEEHEFKALREQHDKAVAAALEPLNRRYQWSLEQLLKRAPTGAQPDLVRQIAGELQSVGGAATTAADTAPLQPLVAPARPPTKAELKQLFANSEWIATTRGEGACVFHKDGTFASKAWGLMGCHWYEIEAPDVLKLYTESPKKPKAEYKAFRVDFAAKSAKADISLGGTAVDATMKYDKPLKAQ